MTIGSPVGTVTTYTCDADPEWFAAVVAKYGLDSVDAVKRGR